MTLSGGTRSWHREVEGDERAMDAKSRDLSQGCRATAVPSQPHAVPYIPLAPHGRLQAVVARLAEPTGSARHVREAAALACAGIAALQPWG